MGLQGQELVAQATGGAGRVEVQVQTRYSGSQGPGFGEGPVVHRLADDLQTRTAVFAAGFGQRSPCSRSMATGDIQCAFLTGSYLDRDEELFISQPVTGFPGMKPGQLVWVKKNMFGLATSPREWWEDLQDGFRRVKIDLGEENYQFDQCPLDPCVFTLRKADGNGFSGPPIGYVGTHVDDLLVVAPGTISTLIERALSQEFPIDDWEAELFSYLGSEVHCCDDEVVMSQKSYVDTRLFKLEIPEGANDDELASEDLVADNRSLVGALSWLSAQTRPDLTCAVSMAQQLQKCPTVGDLKFSNSTARKALDFKDEGLRFKPLDIGQGHGTRRALLRAHRRGQGCWTSS